MQTLESLKRRIRTAEDLRSVVRTMKTLAAVSIRQYEAAAASLERYSDTIASGMQMLLWHHPTAAEVTTAGPHARTGLIVFGSDQGMCGQFNEDIATYATGQIDSLNDAGAAEVIVACAGIRPVGRLLDAGIPIEHVFEVPGSVGGITPAVQEMLVWLDDWRRRHHLRRVILLYQHRQIETTCAPTQVTLLPFDVGHLDSGSLRRWPGTSLPTFTMEPGVLLSALVRQFLFVKLFRAFAESLSSENASRIAAMQAAERSIGEQLGTFRFSYQQQRQTSITEELLDVITGFEALSGEDRPPC
ncbi:ATP synthase gamma chain [Maioricimonas rarisocia]|uniref:ATP synthase gamma chain n=1 Tax=Maioricimonas rarisocia TaxID=2528026 RepID=A0A517Z7T8_9PLAN|nr:F0F1 ATP synthase subunit gamma [Maioricimonas rarisocia]QDU38501.1 ATP synthase gamma chain [Maioricimonas rarisocia]